MRLIDADAFLKEYCEPYPHIYQAMSSAFKHAPTVDAIPVSWIQETMQLAESVGAEKYAEHLGVLLDDWAERKEDGELYGE